MNPTVIKTKDRIVIRCRACGQHFIDPVRWHFSGDYHKPSLSPSVKETCNSPDHPSYRPGVKTSVCHFLLQDGVIDYCGDCTHDLRGKMPLDPFTDEQIAYYSQQGI